ncbi:MAG: hypothetical protein Q8942_06865 [Bacillota bacterium]|nr:hypothetical protein [Bacillota bacterium]
MNYSIIPNLPHSKVKMLIIDARINQRIQSSLSEMNIGLLKTARIPNVYDAISYHPDIMLHHVGGKKLVYAPGLDESLLNTLLSHGFHMIKGLTELTSAYPGDIAYNAARVGNFVIHNTKYTDPILRAELEKESVEFIHVKQGYSKCSISIVDENAIITSDQGIAKESEKKGINVLLIEPDENIILPSLNMGFIGGCTCKIDKNTLAITGNYLKLKESEKIEEFLMSRGISIVSLSDDKPLDVGSLIPIF